MDAGRHTKAGRIILINGASSSGKSTLSVVLQEILPEPFWHYAIDHIRDSGMLPMGRIRAGEFDWQAMRPAFFGGFHASIPALANAGNNLIVEHIMEGDAWRRSLVRQLSGLDVFFVGLHCPLEELERRERARGDRRAGDAVSDFVRAHQGCLYDLELDSTVDALDNARTLAAAWASRSSPCAFERMRTSGDD